MIRLQISPKGVRGAGLATAAFLLLSSMGSTAPATAVGHPERSASTCAPTKTPAVAGRSVRADDHQDLTDREVRLVQREMERALDSASQRTLKQARVGVTAQIPVRVYVIAGTTYRGPSRADVRNQLQILNAAYAGGQSSTNTESGYSFFLKTFDRVRSQRWLTAGVNANDLPDKASREMRRTLHKGGRSALNLYISKPGEGLLGYSSLPWEIDNKPDQDGVTIHAQSMPGGNKSGFNRGDTLVHEVGHWLGLLHTFQGGCANPNDRVSDTPAERVPTSRCPAGKNTCPAPGKDPIHNFMDYSYDTCMYEFTPGQVSRMDDFWLAFRAS